MSVRKGSLLREWEFLCLCASPAVSDLKRFKTVFAELQWPVLLELAEEHGVQGILAMRLQQMAFADVPAVAREKLQTRMRAQHLFTLSMTAELFRILQDFKQAGIESILVKGPLISLLAFGDPAIRSYVDLDLLVRHAEIGAATRRLMELGFVPDIPLNVIHAGKVPGEYLFKRPGTSQIVELHTDRTFRYYPRPMPLEDLFARKRAVLLDGQAIPALQLEDEFLLNCIHGAKHFWERLMWVADIAAIVARHPEVDWKLTQQYAADLGAERMVHVALRLAETLLHVPLPVAVREAMEGDTVARQLSKQVARWLPSAGYAPPAWKQRALFRMRMRGGSIAGAMYLLRLSFSPTEEDWQEENEERRPWVLDALQRPLRLLKKYRSDG